MLDSIYHMTFRILCNLIIGVKNCHLYTQRRYGRHNVSCKSVNHLWFIDFIAWRYSTPRRDVIC